MAELPRALRLEVAQRTSRRRWEGYLLPVLKGVDSRRRQQRGSFSCGRSDICGEAWREVDSDVRATASFAFPLIRWASVELKWYH